MGIFIPWMQTAYNLLIIRSGESERLNAGSDLSMRISLISPPGHRFLLSTWFPKPCCHIFSKPQPWNPSKVGSLCLFSNPMEDDLTAPSWCQERRLQFERPSTFLNPFEQLKTTFPGQAFIVKGKDHYIQRVNDREFKPLVDFFISCHFLKMRFDKH